MLTFFNMIERQGRGYMGQEWNLLTTMIENSNNDSASALFGEVGGASGVASYLQSIGVYDIYPDGSAWGYSQSSPYAMVRLLTRLYLGGIVSSYHRSLAMSLMENVEGDQHWGVGYTAPAGATVAMKNGWLPGSGGLWAVNTSGIVITGRDTYIIAAYSMGNPSFGAGISLVQSICGTVAQQLG